jgi:dihydroorotate dehydrogenase electron transfer subunit
MKHISCRVATTADAFGGHKIVSLAAPDMPHMRPGQLVLARVNDTFDPYLPSAYFPLPASASSSLFGAGSETAGLSPSGPKGIDLRTAVHAGPVPQASPADALSARGTGRAGDRAPASQPASLSLLVDCADPISRKAAGDTLELIAPIGNGFALDPATRRLLLVGDAAHLAPLLALSHEASLKQVAVSLLVHTLALGAQQPDADTASLAAWLSTLLPLEVEYQLTSDLAAVLLGLPGWADQLCASGDAAFFTLLKEQLAREPRVLPPCQGKHARDTGGVLPAAFAQVIVAPPMACGSGACMGCAVETARGIRLACVDGPVFDLAELL